MKVLITTQTRPNGLFLIERWPELGQEIAHGPVDPDKVQEYADALVASIKRQTNEREERLTEILRSDESRAMVARENEKTWLQKRRR